MTVRATLVDDGRAVQVTWPDGAKLDISARLAATLARLDRDTLREATDAS